MSQGTHPMFNLFGPIFYAPVFLVCWFWVSECTACHHHAWFQGSEFTACCHYVFASSMFAKSMQAWMQLPILLIERSLQRVQTESCHCCHRIASLMDMIDGQTAGCETCSGLCASIAWLMTTTSSQPNRCCWTYPCTGLRP